MPELPLPNTQPVWPTSAKVLVALLAGMLISAVVMVQWVPDDLVTQGAANSGPQSFVPFDAEDGTTDTGGTVSQGSTGGKGKGGPGPAAGASVGGGAGGLGTSGGNDSTKGGELACEAGKNGGETDVGVTGDKIRLAANVVTDGPGANFLDQSPDGMEAVVRRVNNKEGGICGRHLELKLVNDGWEAPRGHANIKAFIEEGYFALPVVPSSEGLSQAILAGDIENAGIPVIGTDGMRKEQYDATGKASWVGPVATATVSQVRIMAEYAATELSPKATKFGIVYDQKYKFGVEGAKAYETYLTDELKVPSAKIKMRPIAPSQPNYLSDANLFLDECGDCDLVVLLLEPETGKTWMSAMGHPEDMTIMGAQPLFNDKFASGCGSVCNGVYVWTGYNPAIGANTSDTDVARFMNDVREVNTSADLTNQFLMGAYLGMEVFVELLEQCSPNLTRKCIKEKLNTLQYESGMVPKPLQWSSGSHFANPSARAYTIAYDGQKFSGFKDEQISRADPTPGVVPG